MDNRLRTAARLASSAAARAFFDRSIPDAVIGRDGNDRSYRPIADRSRGDYPTLFAGLAGAEGEALMCGPTFGPTHYSAGSSVAFDEALRLSDDDGPRAAALLHDARQRAQNFVRQNADVIEHLAAELDRQGAMSGDDISATLHHALDRSGNYASRPSVTTPPGPPDVWGQPQQYAAPISPLLYRIAIHEASHAIACYAKGVPVALVAASDDERLPAEVHTSDAVNVMPAARLVILAAGGEGERMICGTSGDEFRTQSFDRETSQQLATHYSRTPTGAARIMSDARKEAREIVHTYRGLIELLASELVVRGAMNGSDLDSFLTQYCE